MKHNFIIIALALLLSACGPSKEQLQAAADAAAAKKEQAAAELARQYNDSLTAQKWEVARMQGAALLTLYPDSEAAGQIKATFDDTKTKAEAQREQERLLSLWTYSRYAVGKGEQRAAMIYGKQPIDVDGNGPRTVQLVFRDHPEWKRSAYLVLQTGDFAKVCYRSCMVKVKTDDGKTHPMAALRPKTDEAIAMFINDHKALWKLARENKAIEIEFPTRDVGAKTVVFETGGINASQMPGWN
jgi:hypothetical protein